MAGVPKCRLGGWPGRGAEGLAFLGIGALPGAAPGAGGAQASQAGPAPVASPVPKAGRGGRMEQRGLGTCKGRMLSPRPPCSLERKGGKGEAPQAGFGVCPRSSSAWLPAASPLPPFSELSVSLRFPVDTASPHPPASFPRRPPCSYSRLQSRRDLPYDPWGPRHWLPSSLSLQTPRS